MKATEFILKEGVINVPKLSGRIVAMRAQGIQDTQIRQQLIKEGIPPRYVDQAFAGAEITESALGTRPKRESRVGSRPVRGHTPEPQYKEQPIDEHGKASRELCNSSKPDADLGASMLSSCKSQGLRARDGNKSHKLGKEAKSRVKVGGKRIKGNKYGGPLPDWS